MIELTCENCGSVLHLDDRFAGRAGQCPDCKAPVTVPVAPLKVGPELPTIAPDAKKPSPRFNRSRVPLIAAVVIIVAFIVIGAILAEKWLGNKEQELGQWAKGQGESLRREVEAAMGESETAAEDRPTENDADSR